MLLAYTFRRKPSNLLRYFESLLYGAQRGASLNVQAVAQSIYSTKTMSEAKEKLERLRAKRGGHRGVCTKLQKEAEELVLQPFDKNGDIVNRCEMIQGMLEEKRKLLETIDEEILALCDVKDISTEIEESAEIVARILKATTKLGRYRCKESRITKQAVSDETITIQVMLKLLTIQSRILAKIMHLIVQHHLIRVRPRI
jgi:hypothetical protein